MSIILNTSQKIVLKNEIPPIKESLFNSKLFIDLESTEESDNSENLEEETTNCQNNSESDDNHLLSNELIKEINSINTLSLSSTEEEKQKKENEEKNEREEKINQNNYQTSTNIYNNSPFTQDELVNKYNKYLIPPHYIPLVNQMNLGVNINFRGGVNVNMGVNPPSYEYLRGGYQEKEYNKLLNNNNFNSYNNKSYKNNKTGKKREWICVFCQNLNYGFRTVCNRCKESKDKSESYYINNIISY